ncbi:hypothetical protein UFOVP54_33 [uncultured Caudovirales phage]|uniref:Uncharacterized protein n=1 Tax=uncultured Caudovirales phage TaxID=2100421 RepID=A0A6J5KUN3_9CAUD|nr:hypothetical protein UFOVP54_33 [uncultured Caudovirales phage]
MALHLVQGKQIATASWAVNALTASYLIGGVSIDTGSLLTTASFNQYTGSSTSQFAGTSSFATLSNIQYVTNSIQSLSQIEVADYSADVAVTFIDGKLKFIFGTPTAPTTPSPSFNGTFRTDRFNQIQDNYDITGSLNVNGYTLISASLYENGTQLANIGTGTTLFYNTTTSGSHTYTLAVTASSPLDGTIVSSSATLLGTLSKTPPGSPTITATPDVQFGATSNQIEQGATGSIAFISASGAANSWVHNFTSTNVPSPVYITGSATGSASILITATSYYSSSGALGADNSPALTTTTTSTTTYTKIRSVRGGASANTAFTLSELEAVGTWTGSIGNIYKGTTTATGASVTITWTGDKYHYIVYNSGLAALANITKAGFGVFGDFTATTVGSYRIYKSNLLQAGGSGTTFTYVLT